jgi:hypothetical protein
MQDHCGDSYVEDNILAGVDEEVLRKVKFSNIAVESLRVFGITDLEFDSYNVN